MSAEQVEISKIVFDEDIYPRMEYSQIMASTYMYAMKSGNKFPPVQLGLYKKKLYLVDGKHRIEAAKLLKETMIAAQVTEYKTKHEMLKAALAANIHGKQLTFTDKTKVFEKLRSAGESDDEIGRLLGVPKENFSVFLDRLVTANGKTVMVRKPTLEALRKNVISEQDVVASYNWQAEKKLTAKSTSQAIDQMLVLLRNHLIPYQDAAIRGKATEVHDLLEIQLGVPT